MYQRSYRKPASAPIEKYSAETAWAAAAAAHRLNAGAYIKSGNIAIEANPVTGEAAIPETISNRELMYRALHDPSMITEADITDGALMRDYFKGWMFKVIQDAKLSEFETTAMRVAGLDELTSRYDMAILASLPSTYIRGVSRDTVKNRLDSASGGHISQIGAKVTATVEVLRSVFSQQWKCYFITGITADDQSVFFSYKAELAPGRKINVAGTVKSHRENKQTQLNRVKIIG